MAGNATDGHRPRYRGKPTIARIRDGRDEVLEGGGVDR
jgi:hypothetical protein